VGLEKASNGIVSAVSKICIRFIVYLFVV